MIDWIAVKQVIGVIKTLANITKWLPQIKKGWNYLFSSPFYVVVYGASGVGKSEFCRSLLGRSLSQEIPRTVFYNEEDLTLPDGHKIRFLDLPGHISYETNRKEALNVTSKVKSFGIINVVSYGYHEVAEAKNLKMFKIPNDTNEVAQIATQYQKYNIKLELEQAREWHSAVVNKYKVDWIITVVNKADIWFAQSEEILDYYQCNGDYTKSLLGEHSKFVKYVFPYCSIISPFCKKPMVLEFGEREKEQMRLQLLNCIKKLVDSKAH